MPINVAAANAQADRLRTFETQLGLARSSLREYRAAISANWQGAEATLIQKAIEAIEAEIATISQQMAAIGADIRSAAEAIRREEEAAEKALKQASIAKARDELENAKASAEELRQKLEEMTKAAASQQGGVLGAALAAANQVGILAVQAAYDDAMRHVSELETLLAKLL